MPVVSSEAAWKVAPVRLAELKSMAAVMPLVVSEALPKSAFAASACRKLIVLLQSPFVMMAAPSK